ncbi:hypothetical protein GCM10007916_29070 [Psychromonas marina]|uniref:Helix-turn-helix domain-containing protein n=1 Tax=Psychromonas marina TaxID=88364 RepID=A0ABQ6E323_9GAMM|nr:helix-turn-helix domain-containing protein [Psychromonas marina]GLS91837.1 hypothetical protein GCM10007916_29070 [Psychromonas marina]
MTQELSKIISSTSDARLKLRLLAVSLFLDGKNRTQISEYLKVSRTSVNSWIQTYLIQRTSGLKEKKHTGRPKGLSVEQLSQLKDFVVFSAVKADGCRLQGKDVQCYVLTEFGIEYSGLIELDTLILDNTIH